MHSLHSINAVAAFIYRDVRQPCYFAMQTFFGSVEETEGFVAAFAPTPLFFIPPKGRASRARASSSPRRCRCGLAPRRDGRGSGLRQTPKPAVFVVVGVADHFLFAVERRDGDNGAKDFLTVGPAGDRQIGETVAGK